MRWMLRITFLVMGVALVGLTAGLAAVRGQGEPNPVVVYGASEPNYGGYSGLYLSPVGSSARVRRIDTAFYYETIAWSPDGQWLFGLRYESRADFMNDMASLWRIHRATGWLERLPGTVNTRMTSTFTFTPDGLWLVWVQWDANGDYGVMRYDLQQGGTPESLVAGLGFPAMFPFVLRASADSQWLYIWVDNLAYRLPIGGGQPEQLHGPIQQASLIGDPADGLLLATATNVFLADCVGEEQQVIFPPSGAPEEGVYVGSAVWLEKPNVVVLEAMAEDHSTLYAYDLDCGTGLWQYPDVHLAGVNQAGGWIVATTADNTLVTLEAELDAAPTALIAGADFSHFYVEDGLMVYAQALATPHVVTGVNYELWHLARDGTRYLLYQPVSSLGRIQHVSQDGTWLAFFDYDPTYYTLVLKMDGTQTYALREGVVLGFLPPINRGWSPLGLMVAGGVLTVGGMVWRKGRSKT